MSEKVKYADLHCDTVLALMEAREKNKKDSILENEGTVDLNKLRQGGCRLQTMALFTDLKGKRAPEHQVLKLFDQYQRILKESDEILPVLTKSDLDRLEREENKTGFLLSLEEGDVFYQDLDLLEWWYGQGVRMIALCWNHVNAIGSPNFKAHEGWDYHVGSSKLEINNEDGLTDFGKQMVLKMNELGILCDVSHLSDAGFRDVIELSTLPVIASHSNARAVCPVSRNLSDEMIQAIAQSGGVIGLNFCAEFLNPEANGISRLDDLVNMFLYLHKTAGPDVVAIGSDFDGISSALEIGPESMQDLFAALRAAGISEEDLEKAAWKNVFRVLRKVLPD